MINFSLQWSKDSDKNISLLKRLLKMILKVKSCNFGMSIIQKSMVWSFSNFALNTAVIMPGSVQKLKMITWPMKWLWTHNNKILTEDLFWIELLYCYVLRFFCRFRVWPCCWLQEIDRVWSHHIWNFSRNMPLVWALSCFGTDLSKIYPYSSGLLHWHRGNHMIAPVSVMQPWRIWVNISCESNKPWS